MEFGKHWIKVGREEIQEAIIIWRSGSQSGVPVKIRGTTPAPGDSIEMQILRACPSPSESKPLGFGPAICVLRRLPALSVTGSKVRPLPSKAGDDLPWGLAQTWWGAG